MCLGVCFCVWVFFPTWVCRFGVQEGTTSFLCVIFSKIDDLVCLCVVGHLVSSCHQAGVCDPGPAFVDGSFVLACVLREATHSLRAIYCLPPHVEVCWFGVLSMRLLHAFEKIRGSPVFAGVGFT